MTPSPMEADEKHEAEQDSALLADLDSIAEGKFNPLLSFRETCEKAASRIRQLSGENEAIFYSLLGQRQKAKEDEQELQEDLSSSGDRVKDLERHNRYLAKLVIKQRESIRQLSSKPGGAANASVGDDLYVMGHHLRDALEYASHNYADPKAAQELCKSHLQKALKIFEALPTERSEGAHLEAVRGNGWRQISEAKMHTEYLVAHISDEHDLFVMNSQKIDGEEHGIYWADWNGNPEPTHFMLLPSPPERSTDGGGK